ncbi:MAG: benzoate/H(+) symporter BenE family transporter [Hamadaea sp.]|nr:benzoate/H(+) symporter BenE family transporter [Hamadaea sp.]NUT21945.1 benzoate/H(+) symporter BenE family transporter [Hamadaea sp.]
MMAGIVTALVGFASSFAVVLAGLRAMGADDRQAASGLFAVCLGIGITAIALSLRYRMPITIAWSTPGAALLVTTGSVAGGFAAAEGAFLVAGLLIVLAALFPVLSRWITAIPGPIASAMLAGVLLELCLAPAHAIVQVPRLAVPVVLVWAVLYRVARAWAVPAALVAAIAAIAISGTDHPLSGGLWPEPVFTMPTFTVPALVSVAVPLFLVTMAAQNIPGIAVLAGFGYHPPVRPLLAATGAMSMGASLFGGHALNLAAISAALAAGPEGGPDPRRRWIASTTAGAGMIGLGLAGGLAMTLVTVSPPILIEAVAGLALLGAFASALVAAVTSAEGRDAAIVTLVVTASGMNLFGIGAAFWGLVAGLLMHLLHRPRRRPASTTVERVEIEAAEPVAR